MNALALLAHQQANDIPVLEILKTTGQIWCLSPSGADDMSPSKPESLVAKVTEMLSAQVAYTKG